MNALGKIFSKKNWRQTWRALVGAFLPNLAILFFYWIFVKSGIYDAFPYIDNPLHILSGAGIAWAVLTLWRYGQKLKLAPKLPFWIAVSYAVGIAAVVGIAWEAYEFMFDLWRGWNLSPNVADFIKDLINDLLGAFVCAIFAARKMLKR
jgi:hypothetical protein